jgi:hypothetical protein
MQPESNDVISEEGVPSRVRPKTLAMGSIAALFRCPFLERVASGTHIAPMLELAEYYSEFSPPSRTTRLSEWFDFFYRLLFENYRCEYVYKNAIATKIFLSRHSLHTSFMTDEIRSAKSRGDVAILNGTSTVYEIKSHYDSFERLDTQLLDYKRIFDRIYIVTTDKKAEAAVQLFEPMIGVIAFREDGTLSVIRESLSNKHSTDPGAIFDCMRQVEYCRAITEVFGYVPQVPNSQLYRHARNMFCSLSPGIAHDLMLEQVKKRGKKRPFAELIESAPVSLKHVCLSFSKSAAMANDIAARLREPLIYEKIFSFPSGQVERIDGSA